jgi:hypothetical protein
VCGASRLDAGQTRQAPTHNPRPHSTALLPTVLIELSTAAGQNLCNYVKLPRAPFVLLYVLATERREFINAAHFLVPGFIMVEAVELHANE